MAGEWYNQPSQFNTNVQNNPYYSFLEENPETAYLSSDAYLAASPGQQRFMDRDYASAWNQYLSGAGAFARQGGDPLSLKFADFIESTPFTKRYSGLTPQQTGRTIGRFNPSTRQIYY